MKLVIGGAAQGKLEYVVNKYASQENVVIVNRLHQWVRRRMESGGCPEAEIMSYVDSHEDCIIICDEIGNGIVPVEPFEREYRECVGRILVQLAGRAEEVERILCGIGQKIK
ncbi:MAG: bifunctional adenosylcobinamide kinase/adenosylcobinamide-phosphate guanylyltransferase [Muribaculaceae bacterium]|nr:bifunctional adenosylcobinamide kinase/adenosylcobinamide-phosphate guanylyltransferase [Roseburia sp.]MCM1431963.1 bifunctional adenosylcobinamide kinase/adenosylcobinamide-phosphate guanylyltransferase [Muribaculaceae bacterium]MCM1493593.1 bifunctional adenosylcobinamide kinase/adenosylcobinamide-phosphate guanylyltransferase [Muribaculaceae bacterium]